MKCKRNFVNYEIVSNRNLWALMFSPPFKKQWTCHRVYKIRFYVNSRPIFRLTLAVSTGGILFDYWMLNHKSLAYLRKCALQTKEKLLLRSFVAFFWDFCVWMYRDSQKSSKMIFLLTLRLKFHGLSQEGRQQL